MILPHKSTLFFVRNISIIVLETVKLVTKNVVSLAVLVCGAADRYLVIYRVFCYNLSYEICREEMGCQLL